MQQNRHQQPELAKKNSFFQIFRGIYFWTMVASITFALYFAVLLIKLMSLMRGHDNLGRSIHRIATIWAQTILRVTPGWKIEISGMENLPKDNEGVVIVANHESMADIWAMYYLGIQFRWLSKIEVFKVPIIGSTMRWAHYVPIHRGNKESHERALQRSAEVLRAGLAMFFFPEGTRSKTGDIKPFKIGAFKLAREVGVDVLPIAIHGARDLLPKGSAIPGRSIVRVRILPQISSLAYTSAEELCETARKQIISAHAAIRSQA